MTNLGRRARGILRMGLAWAVAWAAAIGLLGGSVAIVLPIRGGGSRVAMLLDGVIGGALGGATFGFGTGVVFAVTLAMAERNRGIASLNPVRFALWGALAGAGLAGGMVALSISNLNPRIVPSFIGMFGCLGGLSAAGLLALVRRQPDSEVTVRNESLSGGAIGEGLPTPDSELSLYADRGTKVPLER